MPAPIPYVQDAILNLRHSYSRSATALRDSTTVLCDYASQEVQRSFQYSSPVQSSPVFTDSHHVKRGGPGTGGWTDDPEL